MDPQGLCPEGHYVGTAGARVEQAMGSSAPHPDEPQPWVYTILPGEGEMTTVPSHGGPGASAVNGQPREARPVAAPGMVATDDGDDPAADALLRELHSLSALDELADERQRPDEEPPPPPVTEETSRAPAPEVRPSPPPRPDPGSIADAFAELSALDAAQEPQSSSPPAPSMRSAPQPSAKPPRPDPSPTETSPAAGPPAEAEDEAEDALTSLFGAVEPPPTPAAGDGRATDATSGTPAPEARRGALRAVPSQPPAPPTPAPSPSEPADGAPEEAPDAEKASSSAPPAATIDLTSFTAKGRAVGRNGRGKGRRSRR
ncbi:MAG: hypothetical protein WD638_06225 [Nitriliruptoraceae bacterium]